MFSICDLYGKYDEKYMTISFCVKQNEYRCYYKVHIVDDAHGYEDCDSEYDYLGGVIDDIPNDDGGITS